jgi:hypothetical protein
MTPAKVKEAKSPIFLKKMLTHLSDEYILHPHRSTTGKQECELHSANQANRVTDAQDAPAMWGWEYFALNGNMESKAVF